MTEQRYFTVEELAEASKLIEFCNANHLVANGAHLSPECTLIDGSGEAIGTVKYSDTESGFALFLP